MCWSNFRRVPGLRVTGGPTPNTSWTLRSTISYLLESIPNSSEHKRLLASFPYSPEMFLELNPEKKSLFAVYYLASFGPPRKTFLPPKCYGNKQLECYCEEPPIAHANVYRSCIRVISTEIRVDSGRIPEGAVEYFTSTALHDLAALANEATPNHGNNFKLENH